MVWNLDEWSEEVGVVGFSPYQRKRAQQLCVDRKAVLLKDCHLKESIRELDKLDLVLKGSTKILPSEREFDVPADEFTESVEKEITLAELQNISVTTVVSVKVKVVECHAPTMVSNGRRKQGICIADATHFCMLNLWEEKIGWNMADLTILRTALSRNTMVRSTSPSSEKSTPLCRLKT